MSETPGRPGPTEPDPAWEHIELWKAVKRAIFALPTRFQSELVVSGVLSTDLFAFNASLAATIEEQVIATLNRLRAVWDADQKYALYSFERQPQTFPDVVLRTSAPDAEQKVLMGIELKGWYVLAKEREPSFRYKVTPAVCAPADLLVVVPWALSNVISGSPKAFAPYVIGARQAAEFRNWYWEHERAGTSSKAITLSSVDAFYPTKSDMIADRPASDSGGNFGRFARTGAMDGYIEELFNDKLAGIPLWAWQKFLALFTESQTAEDVQRGLEVLSKRITPAALSPEAQERVRAKLQEIGDIVSSD